MSNPFGGNKTATVKKAASFDSAGPDGTVIPARKGSPFSQPSAGSSDVRISDLVGELLLVKPTEYIESMVTTASAEPVDAIRADVVVLAEDGSAELHEDLLVFQLALKRQLKHTLNGSGKLLARLTMGDKKPGKNAPYLFAQHTEAEAELGQAYCDNHPDW